MSSIAHELDISIPTLSKQFDALDWQEGLVHPAPECGINLIIDATFFGRSYGFFCFHDTQKVIWFCEIKTENVATLRKGIFALLESGYRFKSITIDGKRGFVQALQKMCGGVPVQLCHFHQKATIRRYLTDRPKTECGKDLRELMKSLGVITPSDFIDRFYQLKTKHQPTLNARNRKKEYLHKKLRSAYRSMQDNLHLLFSYTDLPYQKIPHTTNHLEGYFSHLKERVNIHRGLCLHRKKKAIRAFINSF